MTRIGCLLCLYLLATAPLGGEMRRLDGGKARQIMKNAQEGAKASEVQAAPAEEAAVTQTAKVAVAAEDADVAEEADHVNEGEAAQDPADASADEKHSEESMVASGQADALLEEDKQKAADPEAGEPEELTEWETKITNKVLEVLGSPEHDGKWMSLVDLVRPIAEAEEFEEHHNGIGHIIGMIDKIADKVEFKALDGADDLGNGAVDGLIKLKDLKADQKNGGGFGDRLRSAGVAAKQWTQNFAQNLKQKPETEKAADKAAGENNPDDQAAEAPPAAGESTPHDEAAETPEEGDEASPAKKGSKSFARVSTAPLLGVLSVVLAATAAAFEIAGAN